MCLLHGHFDRLNDRFLILPCLSRYRIAVSCLTPASPLHRSCRADLRTVSAPQTVFLLNECRAVRLPPDTVLRTHRKARTAACASFRYPISGGRVRTSAERKREPLDRLFGKVKPFAASLANTENRQCRTRLFRRINFIHIRIFFKQPPEPLRTDFLRHAPHRNSNA